MKRLRIVLPVILVMALTFTVFSMTGCIGSKQSDGGKVTMPQFMELLEQLLPKAEGGMGGLSGGFRAMGGGGEFRAMSGGGAYGVGQETYEHAISSGMIYCALGTGDPLTIWLNMSSIEKITQMVNEGKIPVTAETRTLTLPFAIDGPADSLTVTHTFNTASLEDTAEVDGATFYTTLEDIRGGFTETASIISFNIKIYFDSAKTNLFSDVRFLFYGNENSGADGLVLKSARYEIEGDPAQQNTSRAIFSFNENRSGNFFKYRVASHNWKPTIYDNKISMIMSGNMERFIIRKRGLGHDPNKSYGDQFFAATYDEATHQFGATAASDNNYATGINGDTVLTFDLADNEGLEPNIENPSEGINNYTTIATWGDFTFITAENMFNFNSPAVLPQSKADLTPAW